MKTVGFGVLTAVIVNISLSWDIMPCNQLNSIDVSEEHVASTFRVKE
jgi:hypothetical protein